MATQASQTVSENYGWFGVDLDGSLAYWDRSRGPEHIGEPIMPMVERVREWLANGREVRIITARVYFEPNNAEAQAYVAKTILAIQDWCMGYFGVALPITCSKDQHMLEIWDDRAIQLERNTGRRIDGGE